MSTFNPTPAEIALTSQVFTLADPQKLGIITGDTAVKILSGANLSHAVLGEVWAIADKDNNGFLTRKGVAIALRLIGHAQKGEPITEALLDKPGPPAHIDGVSRPVSAKSPTPSSPAPQSSPPSSALPPLTPQDKTKFLKLFIGCGPVNGLLNGEKARDVFVKSKLSYEKLSHIWNLADTKTRGALDSTDFTIGMYLIQASMSSPSLVLPAALPSWIYDQAVQSLDSNVAVVSHATGSSASALGSPLQSSFHIPRQHTGSGNSILGTSTIKSQYTGQQSPQPPMRQATPNFTGTSASPFIASSAHVLSQQPWSVSAEAKASSDRYFDELDAQRRGYIEGDVAVPFMLESKLPESELAQIWDLADLRNDGHLTRDGFAVAMYLINSRLVGHEIPSILPPALVPPSLRQTQSSAVTISAEPHMDLLLDDTPPGTAVQSQASVGDRPGSKTTPIAGQDAFPLTSRSVFPTHSTQQTSSAFNPVANKDLLGDDDEEASKTGSVPDNSADIGNLRNQVSSTARTLEVTQSERTSTEQAVAQQAQELSQLQAQLSSARASYETESRLLTTLRERLAAQRADIHKIREELITAESELSAMKVEKAEVEGSVLRDKEEIRDLQRKMKEAGAQTESLKVTIEKAKRDARQQKGLLAIAKKQLATAEAERLKSSKELDAVHKESETLQQEKDAVENRLSEVETPAMPPTTDDVTSRDGVASPAPSTFAAAIPLPDTPQAITPQPSIPRQSTNPFERLALASMGSDLSPQPAAAPSPGDASFVTSSDPFGFTSLSVDEKPTLSQSLSDTGITAEVAKPSIDTMSSSTTDFASPASLSDKDIPFLTPPSTANTLDVTRDGVDVTPDAVHPLPGTYPSDAQGDNLLSPLREVEHDGSDTSDSDEEPLGTKLTTATNDERALSDETPAGKNNDHLTGSESQPPSKPKFDDTFGAMVSPTRPSTTAIASSATSGKSSPIRSRSPGRALSTRTLSSHSIQDPFTASSFSQTPLEPPAGEAAPPPTIETVLEPNAVVPNTSNINDFDEALGKLPNSTKDTFSTFKFDSAFDDNFDFSSAVNGTTGHMPLPSHNDTFVKPDLNPETTSFPPVSSPLLRPNLAGDTPRSLNPTSVTEPDSQLDSHFPTHVTSPSSDNGGRTVSFDDAFGISSPDVVNTLNSHHQQPPTNGDDRLPVTSNGTFQGSPIISLSENLFPKAPSSTIPVESRTSSPSPASPPIRPASPPIRPASPPQPRVSIGASRATSSPPRASSPRLRVLSGSKATSSEGKAETKHKLSIRFPFGRKDKTKDKEDKRGHSNVPQQPPEPQQFLSPAPEPSLPGTVTPAVEDDAEPVKQLAAMGFSRTQSIAALETHGYDMQKALNSLLGAA